MNDFTLLSGTANPSLAQAVARGLEVCLGKCEVRRFPDGEVSVQIDEPVRGHDVVLLQPTSPPVSEHLMELLALADACRRSSARRITAIMPYFGYARSDKRHGRREPIMASLVARLIEAAGIDHIVTVDLHAPQIEGFFHIPVDTLTAIPTLCDAVRPTWPKGMVVVSPDEGRFRTAVDFGRRLSAPVVVLHKERGPEEAPRVLRVVGEVRDKPCLIIDDMISTGGTIAESIRALLVAGARPQIFVAATHGVLLEGVEEKLNLPALQEVVVTDTVAVEDKRWPRLRVASIGPLIASAIRRLLAGESLGNLFSEE